MPDRRRSPRQTGPGAPRFVTDPLTGDVAELRRIQPFAARKAYRCPGCNHDVAPGTGHLVIVPLSAAEHRRHWHLACWEQRANRPPGR